MDCHDNRIVFSLTTLPSRINSLYPIIKTLVNQTYPVDCIYLTIPKKCKRLNEKYPEIPDKIKKYCEIVYVREDCGPITKLIGALLREDDPNTIIITVDDDILYPKTLVEDLIYWENYYPNSALSSSGLNIGYYPFRYSIKFNQKCNDYWFTMHPKSGEKVDILYGYSSILYKRRFFPCKYKVYQDFLNSNLENKDLFKNDDVYISCFLNKNGINRRIVYHDDVVNQSGNDALSKDTVKFFMSLDRAIRECEKMGWVKTKQSIKPLETCGGITILVLIILLLFLFVILNLFV